MSDDNLKDLGNETLNDILEELVEMRDYQRERQKDCIHSDTEYTRHYSAGDALQRAINTVVEHADR